jgi:hypothetical protein
MIASERLMLQYFMKKASDDQKEKRNRMNYIPRGTVL